MTPVAGAPWRPLAALAACVLAAHWLALRAAPERLAWGTRPAQVLRVVLPPADPPAPRQAHPAADSLSKPPAAQSTTLSVAPHVAQSPAPSPSPPRRVRGIAPDSPMTPSLPVPPVPRVAAAAETPAADATSWTAPPLLMLPAPASWHYEARALHRRVSLQGTARLDWQLSAGGYEARLQIDVPPLQPRSQSSTGSITADGLVPVRFAERTRSVQAAHFDRAQGLILFSSNRPAVPLQPGAQDRVSVLVQLAAIAAGEPSRLLTGTVISLQTAGTREAERWDFTVGATEVLELPGGSLQTIRLTRVPQREYDLRLELWLGPEADYAPVRLRLTPPNGDWVDLLWSRTDKR